MLIRCANEDDLPQIVEIYNQGVDQGGATADLEHVSVESRRQWFRDHDPACLPIWVAEVDGAIAGWCSLSAYRPGRLALRHTAEISYYVHLAHRRQGIARQLIRHAIEQCPLLDISNLMTFTLDVNKPSIRILEEFEFSQWGYLPNIAQLDGYTCGHLILGRPVAPKNGQSKTTGSDLCEN